MFNAVINIFLRKANPKQLLNKYNTEADSNSKQHIVTLYFNNSYQPKKKKKKKKKKK